MVAVCGRRGADCVGGKEGMMERKRGWTLVVVVLGSMIGLMGVSARTAPSGAEDIPVALDGRSQGDLFLAIETDGSGRGGIGRMAPDCTAVERWRTAEIVDISADRLNSNAVWVLEDWPESAHGDRRLRHYTSAGALLGWFPVPGSARYIQSERQGYGGAGEMYVLHEQADGNPARVTVHGENGALLRTWNVPGGPRGLGMNFSGAEDRPVYVAVAGPAGRSGTLLRYSYAGALIWEKPLDVVPVALSVDTVVGVLPSDPDGAGVVVHVRDDAQVIRTWPLEDFVPLDVADVSASDQWVLGHIPGARGKVSLRRYRYDGTLQSSCNRFPQPSLPTPQGTVACPISTPGSESWRYAASGNVAAIPAIAHGGTVYIATTRGLLYAVDCAGRRKWLFDYRLEAPGFGPQAFEGAPAVDETGVIYIGDDVVVPNYFFAIGPDGRTKWVQEYASVYSQIDASPALAAGGHIFTAAHGWGGGVNNGAILILHRDGRRLRPSGEFRDEEGVGPITNAPALLANGAAAYLSPPFDVWVLPTGTPPTVTPVPPRATRTPNGTVTPSTAVMPSPHRVYLPHVSVSAVAAAASIAARAPSAAVAPLVPIGAMEPDFGARRSAAPAQPLPPPYVTQPVPSRLRLVRAGVLPDVVVDLPGFSNPSSPATDGRDVWFTAVANDGAHLLAYRASGAPYLALDRNIEAGVHASPVLGRRDEDSGLLEVLLMGTDGRLVRLDASADTGAARVRWSRYIGEPAAGAPVLGDDGRVYVASGQVVQALDRASGEVAWSLSLDSPVSGSLNLASGGMMYVATQSGEVLAIGTAAGGLDPLAAWPAFRRDARNTGAGEEDVGGR